MKSPKRKLTDEELEDPETWDYESATLHPPVKDPRAVVSVGFPAADFRLVAEYARSTGMKLSEFIRVAAIDAATCNSGSTADVAVTGVGGHVVLEESKASPSTRASSQVIQSPQTDGEYTSSVA